MSLFDPCQYENCRRVSAMECVAPGATAELCAQHVGKFLYEKDVPQAPTKLNIGISDHDCTVLKSVQLDQISDKLVGEFQQARDEKVNELLRAIMQANQECAQKVLEVLATCSVVQKELETLVFHEKTPLNKPEHFAAAVTSLKQNNALDLPKLEQVVEDWLRNHPQCMPEVDIDMDLAVDIPVRFAAPVRQSSVQPPAHMLIEIARVKGMNVQTPEEAVQFLCSQNFVFDIQKYPGLSLENLDLENADLSGGVFIGVSLEGSNLKGAKLENAILWHTSLKRCNLIGATVTPAVRQTNWRFCCIAYSSNGEYVAFGGKA